MSNDVVRMINEVFITGKVEGVEVKSEGKVLDLKVSVKTYYNSYSPDKQGFRVDTHNIYLVSNTGTTLEFIKNSTQAKKPTYISVYGYLSERTLPPTPEAQAEGKEYGPKQTFILGRQVLSLANSVETPKCRAYVQGEIVFKTQKHNSNNTPIVFMILKNRSDYRDKATREYVPKYTGVGVSVFGKHEHELPFSTGDVILAAGDLDSYELRDYEGLYNSQMKSWDFMSSNYSDIQSAQEPVEEDGIVTDIPTTQDSANVDDTENMLGEEDLPF